MQALASSPAFWPLLLLAAIVVYLLPTLIGLIRCVDALALVFVVNLIGAPAGIGWLAAMILAFGPRRIYPAPRRVTGQEAAYRLMLDIEPAHLRATGDLPGPGRPR
jgi:hypothetical protein